MSITLMLTIITGLVSFMGFNNPEIVMRLSHYPYEIERKKEYYRFLTSGFVHANWPHLLFNGLALYTFGLHVEHEYIYIFGPEMGKIYYLIMYLTTIVVAGIHDFLQHRNNPGYYAVGASGGVSGILFASILFGPWNTIYVYFFPIWAIVAGVLYLAYSWYAARNNNDHIGHNAHFYGGIFGFVFTVLIAPFVLSSFLSQVLAGPF